MSKQNISATVDDDVGEYVSRDSINTSGLVNKLLRQHMNGGADKDQILEFRIDQVRGEIEELESRLQRKREEYQELQERRSEQVEEREDVIADARSALSREDLEYQNQKVAYWADQAGMEKGELVAAIRDRT
jgi:septal ring factor EnvC (AmiA/AmiB activator)